MDDFDADDHVGTAQASKDFGPSHSHPQRRRSIRMRPDWAVAAVITVGTAFHWLAQSELALSLLALSPLLLLVLRGANAKAYVYAGLMSLSLGAAELVHPLNLPSPAHMFGVPPHRVLSLLVMALVLLRLRAAYSGLHEQSRRDPLTGLLNRRGFEELAVRELERASRYDRPAAFALIDVDRFKEVNDRFGHAHGDQVLRAVSAQLSELRTSDLAVRLGGDEFGLLMPETDQAAAERVAARLKQRVAERTLAQGHLITISVGIAGSGPGIRSVEALIAEADRRMYLDKPAPHASETGSHRLHGQVPAGL